MSSKACSTGVLDIPLLTGDNFKKWLEEMEVFLCLKDLDLCLREKKPADLTDSSTTDEKNEYASWETSNRKSIVVIKSALTETLKDSINIPETTIEYLWAIRAKFDSSKKAQAGDLMSKLTSSKFDGNGSAREHILEMISLGNKIKGLDINFDDDFLVTLAINSLPEAYKPLRSTYNVLQNKWDLDELIKVVT
ncbi:uncharacterized protein LOC122672402 [Telopea speciosissima]|uniref:uncharacterized protein LOC122672402 n=1 Tax=Telopea speciosissima TaxID=54955 RepID=UPI001CC44F0D|nr:uncharacterized protein LOC122672402 [Telopea speciosissima]